jgi:hypothetical protein
MLYCDFSYFYSTSENNERGWNYPGNYPDEKYTYTFKVQDIKNATLGCITSIEGNFDIDRVEMWLRLMKGIDRIDIVYSFSETPILRYFDDQPITLEIHSDTIPTFYDGRFQRDINIHSNIKKVVFVYHQDYTSYDEMLDGGYIKDVKDYVTSKDVEFEFQVVDEGLDNFY